MHLLMRRPKIGVTNVIHPMVSGAQRTAVRFGQNMTGHDTTPCMLEEVSSLRRLERSSETHLLHVKEATGESTETHALLVLIICNITCTSTKPITKLKAFQKLNVA